MSDFTLPEELMMNIWLRLPIKSTVRFRCISKSWCASFSDPQFIYKNLTLSAAENQNENDLLLVLDNREYYSVVCHGTLAATPLQMSPLRGAVREALEAAGADPLDIDYTGIQTYCCDDLVCFHDDDGVVGVWNLTTGETKMLPPAPNQLFRFKALGFGFDDKIQDYKIVQMGHCGADIEVYVYSLRSGNNFWRKLDQPNVPESPFPGSPSCCSYRDGVFYWGDFLEEILSFDMCSEVFNTISIPPQLPHYVIERICKLKDGSMLLISGTCYCWDDNCRCDVKTGYNLWAWLEVGVTQSLTKLVRIDWRCAEEQASPLGFWRNDLVFECSTPDR